MLPRMAFDPVRARACFPQFDDGITYLENAGGSYVAQPVVDRLTTYLTTSRNQPGWPFASAERARARMGEGFAAAAGMLGTEPENVVFGHSTTNLVYVTSRALLPWLRGHAIVVTDQDHEANTGAWRRLADEGVEVRVVPVHPEHGGLELAAFEERIDGAVRLVAMPHVSNIVGAINPVRAVADLVHAAGGLLFVDGVAAAPHRRVDVDALGADFYVFSAYKTFGPHLGVMYVAPHVAEGGVTGEGRLTNQNHYFLDEGLQRLTPGGKQYEQVAAMAGVADYLDALDPGSSRDALFEAFAAHESALVGALLEGLRARGVRLLGPVSDAPDARVATVSFVPTAAMGSPAELCARMAAADVAIGGAHFYAPRVLDGVGVDPAIGVARVSLVHTNLMGDVERFFAVLDA